MVRVLLVVPQVVDAFAEGHDGRVDVAGLLETLILGSRPAVPLRTGQVNERHPADSVGR